MDSPCRKDRLPVDYVQRHLRRNEFRDDGERDSGESGKVFGFRPESVFTFIPESRSTSSRNPVHLPAGMPFSLPRNTQLGQSRSRRLDCGRGITAQAVCDIVARYSGKLGLGIAPHDLRRTFAKLAHKGHSPIEQIQMSLGHASIQTTERYLGIEQDLSDAPCDHLGLRF